MVRKVFRYLLNRLGADRVCDRQTDRQTEGQTDERTEILIANAALNYVARPKT